MKIVLLYDKLIRPDTTGTHCETALRQIGLDVIHYPPLAIDAQKIVLQNWDNLPSADLYLQIDDDIAYLPPKFGAPSAYWCIDVHRMNNLVGGDLTRWQKIDSFDRVVSAQRDMAKKLHAPWLPLAYDPAAIYPIDKCEMTYDWCFIGNLIAPQRIAAVEQLKSRIPSAFVGQAYGQEMNRIYNQSRIAINISIGNDVNMRFFEAQGSGTPLLTNRTHNGEDELFDGVFYFDSIDELPQRVVELLKQPEQLAAAAQRQLARVRREHTYVARMRRLLELCGFPQSQ